jgi:hypothetical protein
MKIFSKTLNIFRKNKGWKVSIIVDESQYFNKRDLVIVPNTQEVVFIHGKCRYKRSNYVD